MAKRIITVFFVSILSLGYLSFGLVPKAERRLASCVDPVAEANLLPLPGGLFGEIKDEALKKSTMDYYLFLTQVEMQALAGRQSVRAMYGLSDSAPASILPTITPFDPKANAFATGFLWGQFESAQPNSAFTVGKSMPQVSVPPYTLGYVNPSLTASAVKGLAFPSSNGANHKVGTF
jgi:hypothetical protein